MIDAFDMAGHELGTNEAALMLRTSGLLDAINCQTIGCLFTCFTNAFAREVSDVV